MKNKEILIKEQIEALKDERRYLAHIRTILDNRYDQLAQKRASYAELKEIDDESERRLEEIHEIDKKIEELEAQLKFTNKR